ncbi:MAG: T9SS type A sorting domain-containing protein [Bacteroidota bacterium]
MERKDFLKGIGIAGVASVLPFGKSVKATTLVEDFGVLDTCTLIPAETRGPYPSDNVGLTAISRADIRVDSSGSTGTRAGIPMTLTITVQNTDCVPIAGARVDIWHCDMDGYYSGNASQPGYLGTKSYPGSNFLRGYLTTDNNGQVVFTTIYPGWYTSRAQHIHVEVYINGTLQRVSQFAFPEAENTIVNSYAGYNGTSNGYQKHGQNTTTNTNDNVFSDSFAAEVLTISGTPSTSYVASHSFTLTFTVTPLSLLSFNAAIHGDKASLWWSTENEVNFSHFEIERSSDSYNFISAGKVTALNGILTNSYTFSDVGLFAGNNFYRLKMVDKDGSFKYSVTVLVNSKLKQHISVSPNPAKNSMILTHPKATAETAIQILKIDGRQVATGRLQAGATATSVDVSILARGVYLLVFISNSEKQAIKFFKD